MAHEEALRPMSYPASADLSANQYYIVKLDSSGNIALAGEGDQPIGILQDAPAAAGRAGNVAVGGGSKVRCGGTITRGTRFTVNSAGLAVAVGSGDDFAMGIITGPNAASGLIVSCLIQPTGFRSLPGLIN